MSLSRRLPFRIFSFLLLIFIACGFFMAPAASPVKAQDAAPTPVPTILPPGEEAAPPAPAAQPAAAPRFKPFTDIVLDYIKMTGHDEGWAITGQTVLTTVNAGLTWREASPPEPIPDGATVNTYGAFLDAKTAWIIYAFNGQIKSEAVVWHTTDGGLTWTPGQPLNHQVFGDKYWAEFTVLDAKNIWLMIRGVFEDVGSNYDHRLYRSSDGGLTWDYLPSDVSDNYTGMAFSDPGFGLRTQQSVEPFDGLPPVYEITLDGGVTWAKRQLPAPPDDLELFNRYAYCETFQPVALSSESYRMLVGCYDNVTPHQAYEGYFYMTKNDGKTWLFGKLPVKARADLAQLVYFDAKHIYLLGRDSFQSSDDGMKWIYLKVVNWDGQFSFVDPQHGWAIARIDKAVSLVKTTNKAATWKIVSPRIVR